MSKDDDANLRYPATWGMDHEFAMASHAARPHPLTGYPELFKYARKYFPEWSKKCAEQHKHAPSGMLHMCEQIDSDEIISLVLDQVTDKMKCHYCGGKGHPTNITLADGTKVECAKKILDRSRNGKQDSAHLTDVTDAHAMTDMSEQINALTEHVSALELELANKLQSRHVRPRRALKSADARAVDSEDTGGEVTNDDDDKDDGESDESAASVASQGIFANQLQSKFRLKRK